MAGIVADVDFSQEDYESPKAGINEPLMTRQPNALQKTRDPASTPKEALDHRFYPIRFQSLLEWVVENVQSPAGSPYYELALAIVGELFASFFKWFPIYIVIGFIRSDSGLVHKYGELMPLFVTVFVSSAISYYTCRRYSADANPSISFYRGFLPDITRFPMRWSGVKHQKRGGEWLISGIVLTLVKIATQFAAAWLIIVAAHYGEPKGNLGFPDGGGLYTALGFPYMMPSAAGGYSRAGFLLFIAAFMDGLIYLTAHLEFVKIRGPGTSTIYVALGTTLAYMISYYATSTPLNIWLPLVAMAFHQDSTPEPVTAMTVPVVLGYGLATLAWIWIFRSTSQSNVRTTITDKDK